MFCSVGIVLTPKQKKNSQACFRGTSHSESTRSITERRARFHFRWHSSYILFYDDDSNADYLFDVEYSRLCIRSHGLLIRCRIFMDVDFVSSRCRMHRFTALVERSPPAVVDGCFLSRRRLSENRTTSFRRRRDGETNSDQRVDARLERRQR